MDFLEFCIQKYFEVTNWQAEHQYSSLLRPSKEILDFNVPSGLTISIRKSISEVLKHHSTLTLPLSGSIGVLFTSIPLPSSVHDHPEVASYKLYHKKVTESVPNSVPSYLLYGRLFRDARLDYILARRISERTLFTMEGSNSWPPGSSYINYLISTNRERWGYEFSFCSEASILGFRFLRQFAQGWQAGGEMYYLTQGVGGGMSFGLKRKSPYSTSTLTLHPLLWHVSTTYSIHLMPGLDASCRYDYNGYSYESDLSFGFILTPPSPSSSSISSSSFSSLSDSTTITTSSASSSSSSSSFLKNPTCLKVSMGVKKGLALVYQQTWKNQFSFSLGFISHPKQNSIGMEVAWFL